MADFAFFLVGVMQCDTVFSLSVCFFCNAVHFVTELIALFSHRHIFCSGVKADSY